MLTITAPIALKCKSPAASPQERFYHQITDNYSMLSQKLTPEDLLHVVTTPPEYYFGEGDQMNIFQQTNVTALQQNQLEIVNNLINRILVSESAQLTYQDRVYITDVLQKLGIRNVQEFMRQVSQVTQEQKNTQTLIDLYWAHAADLQQLVENYRSEQISEQHRHEQTQQEERLYLHEEVMNRLQTAVLYQIMQSFQTQHNSQDIAWSELQLSEQYRLSQQILLQKLKSEAHDEPQPLTYYHENYYEQEQLTSEEISENHVLHQVSAAVLLNLIDNVYSSRFEQTQRGTQQWYHMERALYQNADNTMKRFENRMQAIYNKYTNREDLYLTQHNAADHKEIEILRQLFVDENSPQYQTVHELLHRNEQVWQNRSYIRQEEQQLTFNQTQLELEQNEQQLVQEEQHQHTTQLELVEQEISRINRENINQQSRYLKMMQHLTQAMELPQEQKSAVQQKQESLLALEHPTQLLEQLQAEGKERQQQRQEHLTQAIQVLPEETRQVYETLREYLEAPQIVQQQMTGISRDMGTLIRDIQSAETIHEQTEQEQLQVEQLQEQTRTYVERWNERTAPEPQTRQVTDMRRSDLTLVHKQQEQQLDEEMITELIAQNRRLSQNIHTTTEQQTNLEQTKRTVTNVQSTQLQEQTENVTELVRQGVQRELGELSDRIYSKLEKRLEAEKRRRGY